MFNRQSALAYIRAELGAQPDEPISHEECLRFIRHKHDRISKPDSEISCWRAGHEYWFYRQLELGLNKE